MAAGSTAAADVAKKKPRGVAGQFTTEEVRGRNRQKTSLPPLLTAMHVWCQLLRVPAVKRAICRMALCGLVAGPAAWARTGRSYPCSAGVCTVRVHVSRKTGLHPRFWLPLLLSLSVFAVTTHAETRREASGWLSLERDQRAYRERVEPLDLREQRQLGVIERSQRNDLRALQQRQQRALQFERQSQRRIPDADVPRRDLFPQQRRAVERKRLQIRMQQDGLPYGR